MASSRKRVSPSTATTTAACPYVPSSVNIQSPTLTPFMSVLPYFSTVFLLNSIPSPPVKGNPVFSLA
uniref:Uncharacterized protein n=1 Tax=uncultured marine virus TaxID=186617 RepID=A0A0F7L360_9VIRU|nr:hypothetical protein [uncultured marine virus]